ncbi:MAG: hypothetical protein ACP5MH_10990 [Thermoproteus sp.]
MVKFIRLALGLLVTAFGLSQIHSWLLAPTVASIPYVGLAVTGIGIVLLATAFAGGRRRIGGVKPEHIATGAIAAGAGVLILKTILDEVQRRSAQERALAAAKVIELEQEYQKVKDRLTPEQRTYWERQIAELKAKYGVK